MPGTDVSRSALERVEPQRDRLAAALRGYELAALDTGADWSSQVGGPLERLRSAFEQHVEYTESPDGLFEEMLHDDAISVEVASEIDHLRRDHINVIVAMDRAAEGLAAPSTDDAHLREVVASVARLVGAHRRRGAQLLYDVYSVDISTGD
jgi:hypothetical protein